MIRTNIRGIGAALAAALSASGATLASALPDGLANIAYSGIYEQPVQLVDGVYEGQPFVPDGASRPRVELLRDLYATGDIDGDGTEDAWVLLNESSGGTGQILYLAAVTHTAGEPRNLGTIAIGDRVDVISLEADDPDVRLDYVTAAPGEPACCPTLMIRGVYGLKDGQPTELSREERGALSLAELAGQTWRLARFDWNEPVAEAISITAEFDGDRISGTAGCNSYFGTIEAPTPYALTLGPMGWTRKACPPSQMEAEDRYLKALQAATQFSFVLGRLSISYALNEEPRALIFERGHSE